MKKNDKEDKKEMKISLINFKIENNLTEMDYVGLKFLLKAEDDSLHNEKDLIKGLKDFRNKPAFIE